MNNVDSELVIINTVASIKADVLKGKRTIKKITAECKIFAEQVEEEYKDFFNAMSECKTRREFESFFSLVL